MSFGVTECEPGEELARTSRRADDALLQAKRDGRDRVVLHDAGGTVGGADDEARSEPFLNGHLTAAEHT